MNRNEAHAQNVARAKSMDDKLAAFGSRHSPVIGVVKADVRGRNSLDVVSTSAREQPVVAKKVERPALHVRVKSVEGRLSENAARALDYVVRKDEAIGGSRLVDVIVHQLASALDLPEKEAEAARQELEQLGLIRWYDNFSGDRGYRPKV